MGVTMRANARGESVQATTTGKWYTAGPGRIVPDVSEDDVAELERVGWRRMVAAVAQSVVAIANGTTVTTTIARNRPA
jgi:hypothetical protein